MPEKSPLFLISRIRASPIEKYPLFGENRYEHGTRFSRELGVVIYKSVNSYFPRKS